MANVSSGIIYSDIPDLKHAGEAYIFDISNYLNKLNKAELHNLGMALGLSYTRLTEMKNYPTFCADMVAAWISKLDFVQTRGMPTWRNLVTALRKVGQNGIANKIMKDEGIKELSENN